MIPLDPTPNLIDQVYSRILEGIADHTLPPGHRIRQNELADKLGVSRQPVSHALHLLVVEYARWITLCRIAYGQDQHTKPPGAMRFLLT